jgi:hypothetical protein
VYLEAHWCRFVFGVDGQEIFRLERVSMYSETSHLPTCESIWIDKLTRAIFIHYLLQLHFLLNSYEQMEFIHNLILNQ